MRDQASKIVAAALRFTVVSMLLLLMPAGTISADESRLQLASRLIDQGEVNRAQREIDTFLTDNPEHPGALFLRGRALVNRGDIRRAIRIYSQLNKTHPELPEPYNNLAALYVSQGNYQKAEAALKKALQGHQSYSAVYSNLSTVYMMMASQAYADVLGGDGMGGEKVKPVSLVLLDSVYSLPEPVTDEAVVAHLADGESAGGKSIEQVSKEVLQTLHSWADSWSRKDVTGYLFHYSDSFKPSTGASLRDWARVRSVRIKKPKYIKVSVGEPQIRLLGETHASVLFYQTYESDRFKDTVRKHLLLDSKNGQWRIMYEDIVR